EINIAKSSSIWQYQKCCIRVKFHGIPKIDIEVQRRNFARFYVFQHPRQHLRAQRLDMLGKYFLSKTSVIVSGDNFNLFHDRDDMGNVFGCYHIMHQGMEVFRPSEAMKVFGVRPGDFEVGEEREAPKADEGNGNF